MQNCNTNKSTMQSGIIERNTTNHFIHGAITDNNMELNDIPQYGIEHNNNDSKSKKDLGLYIHIPFCVKKCDYCDFLSAPATEATIKQYFEALRLELESYHQRASDYIVPTIFFGGGTPSSVEASYILNVMELIYKIFEVDQIRLEATIEVNPGTLTVQKLLTYKEAGINRLSFGLQSAKNKELELLGRIHTYEQFEANYLLARELGFTNINVDLMSALPGQTLHSWENTLNKIISLEPEHISAYSLIIEEGTKFYDKYREGAPNVLDLPDEDTDRLIYHRTKAVLESKGYHRYEISNYAKDGYECRHNSSYWLGTDYLGVGLGASSLLDGARISNMHDIKQYIDRCKAYKMIHFDEKIDIPTSSDVVSINQDLLGIHREYDVLTKEQRMEEYMFLGLRMCAGISKNTFFMRFGAPLDEVYSKEIKELMEQRLIVVEGDNLHLTDFGIDVSNRVLSVFLLN